MKQRGSQNQDFQRLGEVIEANGLRMHALA